MKEKPKCWIWTLNTSLSFAHNNFTKRMGQTQENATSNNEDQSLTINVNNSIQLNARKRAKAKVKFKTT